MAHVITGLRLQKRNPRRANLYLDGEFALGLSLEVVQDFGLRLGRELSDEELGALRQAQARYDALRDAVRLLAYRPRSRAELEKYLLRRGQDAETVQAVLARLEEVGLIDDRAFARAWVEVRQSSRPRGREALRAELREKGVAGTLIDQVLTETLAGHEENQLALALARARAASLAGVERTVFLRRLRGFLLRRGFSPQTVDAVVRRVWTEHVQGTLEADEG